MIEIYTGRVHRLENAEIEILKAIQEKKEKCIVIVVPQASLQTGIKVMRDLNLSGSFTIDITSSWRFDERILERAGYPNRILFDESGKRMIMAKAMASIADQLTVYKKSAENGFEGFVAKMSGLIANYKQLQMTPQDIRNLAESEDELFGQKIRETALIYEAYEKWKQDQLADSEDYREEICRRIGPSRLVDDQHVLITGFDQITGDLAAEALEMARHARSVKLFVETDRNGADDGQIYAPVNYSIEHFAETAKEKGHEVRYFRVDEKLNAEPEICFLEKNLFSLVPEACEGEPKHIELRAYSSRRNEVRVVASQIRELLAQGEKIEEIAVVYTPGLDYEPYIASIFPSYGIHPYISEKRSIEIHPLCRFILFALALASSDNEWQLSDLTECVQSGFLDLTREEADEFCTYCEVMCIRGSGLRKPFRYRMSGKTTDEDVQRIEESRKKAVDTLIRFKKRVARAQTADETITAIYQLLEEVHAYEKLEDLNRELQERGMIYEAQDTAQIWNALMAILDQMHSLLEGSKVTAGEAYRLLASGFSTMRLSAIPSVGASVICGNIETIRLTQIHHLFAIGLNDIVKEEELLFTKGEMEKLSNSGLRLNEEMNDRLALAHLGQLRTLSSVQKELHLSYALADEGGIALRQGMLVQAVCRVFPGLHPRGGLPEEERIQMMSAVAPSLEPIAVRLAAYQRDRKEIEEPYREVFRYISKSEYRDRLEPITRQLKEEPPKVMDRIQAQQLYSQYNRRFMSVSQLEKYAACPYQYFVEYGLNPEKEKKPGVDPAEMGTIYHEAIDQFVKNIMSLPEFPNIDDETCSRMVMEALDQPLKEWRRSPLGETRRGEAVARKAKKTVLRTARNVVSQYAASDFVPFRTELSFGEGTIPPIRIEMADGSNVYLRGRIDRIDIRYDEEKESNALRVIDYKSAMKTVEPTLIYYGLQLQLLIYLAAALRSFPGTKAAGLFYCTIKDPTIKTEKRIVEEVERQIAEKLALNGIYLSDVKIQQDKQEETSDGKKTKRVKGKAVDQIVMDELVSFAQKKAGQLAENIYSGDIQEDPYELSGETPCQYCDYASQCDFDATRMRRRKLLRRSLDDVMDW